MIDLPSLPDRQLLISFLSAISILFGILVGISMSVLISTQWFYSGFILSIMIFLTGMWRFKFLAVLYEKWNQSVRFLNRILIFYVLCICYYFIVVPLGKKSSLLNLNRLSTVKTLWIPRTTLIPDSYRSQYNVNFNIPQEKGRVYGLYSWAKHSRNWWAFCLLPFMAILYNLKVEQNYNLPTNIYTLY